MYHACKRLRNASAQLRELEQPDISPHLETEDCSVLASAAHILKLKRYKEDLPEHGPWAEMTHKFVKCSIFQKVRGKKIIGSLEAHVVLFPHDLRGNHYIVFG